jgi:anti-sigma factor RsiW
MECAEVRSHLLGRRRGALSSNVRQVVDEHLAGCERCRDEDRADRELSATLERHLPRVPAPASLRRTLEARWGARTERTSPRTQGLARMFGAMALGAALVALAVFAWRARAPSDAMVAEAVNDHLRVLYGDHLDVQSSDRHQVKPWFTGRLDFAPDFPFAGDEEFPLQGGDVAYFLDRKAAAFVFKRRLHSMTLLVFRAEGLPWPALAPESLGEARGVLQTSRGFHVLLWRRGDLGFGLVSDVDEQDVRALAEKIARGG